MGSTQVENIINENSNLIYSICVKYSNYCEIEDLYQVGIIGLMRALNNYDANKNIKFSTYAFPYIVGEISKYARENRNIKIGRDILRLGKKINEYVDKYFQVRGYKPTVNEIASTLNIKEDKVIMALDSNNKVKSLSDQINDDNNKTLIDIIPDINNISKEELIDLKEALNTLSEDEKTLIVNRYYNDLTQSEVADLLGVNQVYVSRLERKTLTKMKELMR